MTWVLALACLSGCSQLGPTAISNGRSVYNQSIIDSGDRQTLATIARLRYCESMGLLHVSSITANIRVTAELGGDFEAWGTDGQVEGNLVPLSAGIAYEENPTISYTPIDGAEYVRELLSPIPIDLMFLLLRGSFDQSGGMIALIESINGIRNPAFVVDLDERDARFPRLVELVLELKRADAFHWARTAGEKPGFALVISRYAPDHTGVVREILDLIGVPTDTVESGADVVIPVWLSDGTTNRPAGLAIETRSIFDLLNIACASMDVPPEHAERGWVQSYPELGAAGDLIRIRRTKSEPEAAMVAVEHHGWWYYIDASDTVSKQFFHLLQTLVSVRIAESAKRDAQLPVLTVPVSR